MTRRLPEALLCAVFFLSGASALVFEALWFRLTGLAFGNSVWASALVLSAFMAGLALGNGLAARFGARIRRPVRFYAVIELAIAVFGIALVGLLPYLTGFLAPVLRTLLDAPALLNVVRLSISFVLLLVPATAMGATLPLLVKALGAERSFGVALGRLYGWNTLGAVAGALTVETVFIGRFGVFGTGLVAGALDVLAAAGALALARYLEGEPKAAVAAVKERLTRPAVRILAACFLSGGTLLAFEVVWFRFLQLFFPGTTLTFAVMLSIVLAGIGLGGLVASLVLRYVPSADRHAPLVALAAGTVSILIYAGFDVVAGDVQESLVTGYGLASLDLALALMFPTSLLSGVLFTLTGTLLQRELGGDVRAAGLATMSNTIGSALGSLVAGFALVPRIGMELSFLVLALVYGAVALLLARRTAWGTLPGRIVAAAFALAFVLAAALFPFGRMQSYMDIASAAYRRDGSKLIAAREGLIETIQYLRKDFMGEPQFYRLVTNGYSMSGTMTAAKRYMKAYVYLPAAVHPALESAVLISFGTGSTAKALVDTPSLKTIDVVDISPEILDMADVVFPEPGENPLDDPRLQTHVEDGRFFLLTTDRRFDLITSEPPPPKAAGVVNLYTQEYFQLIHDRLAEGGFCTYWLPVVQFTEPETLAIVKAFLNVFGDETTLWSGCGLDWMLVGSRNATGGVTRAHFERQWNDAKVGRELRDLGFESPAQLGASFLMGPEDLAAATAGIEPLTDDQPHRLGAVLGMDLNEIAKHKAFMDASEAQARFASSAYVRRLWPDELHRAAAAHFPAQRFLTRITVPPGIGNDIDFPFLHRIVTECDLAAPVLWATSSTAALQNALDQAMAKGRAPGPRGSYHLGLRALSERRFTDGATHFGDSYRERSNPRALLLQVYCLCLAQKQAEARALVAATPELFRQNSSGRAFREWLSATLGL